MLFDTLSPVAPPMSKVLTNGIVKWGIRNVRDLEKWNPRLRFLEQRSALAGYQKIESTPVRWIYKLVSVLPMGDYDMLSRFEYRVSGSE